MKDKLIELIKEARDIGDRHCEEMGSCAKCHELGYDIGKCGEIVIADYLIAHGVTLQTTPISYERLLELASKMHCWVFLHSFDEQEAYDELGLTDEENYILGYGGSFEVRPEPPKEGE